MTGNGDPILRVRWTCGGCGRRLQKEQSARIDLDEAVKISRAIREAEGYEGPAKLHRRVEIACPWCDPEVDVGVVEEVEDDEQ